MEKRETGVGAYYFCDIAMSYSGTVWGIGCSHSDANRQG